MFTGDFYSGLVSCDPDAVDLLSQGSLPEMVSWHLEFSSMEKRSHKCTLEGDLTFSEGSSMDSDKAFSVPEVGYPSPARWAHDLSPGIQVKVKQDRASWWPGGTLQ